MAVATWALSVLPAPSAHAAGCPDVEIVFARGTTEAPGVGDTGQAFVDSLRTQLRGRTVGVYPVDYPATTDWPTAMDGIRDASRHIKATAANCPNTKMVLGGFSQGAAVMGFVTDAAVPDGISETDVPQPMPLDVANHVAAVALFGKPSTRFMSMIGQPQVTLGPVYEAKTIDLCVPDDLICSASGMSFDAHNTYIDAGMADQAAVFAAGHINAMSPPPAVPPPAAAPPVAPPPPVAVPLLPAPVPAAPPPVAPPPAAPPPVAPPPAAPPPLVAVPVPAGPLPGPAKPPTGPPPVPPVPQVPAQVPLISVLTALQGGSPA